MESRCNKKKKKQTRRSNRQISDQSPTEPFDVTKSADIFFANRNFTYVASLGRCLLVQNLPAYNT